MLVSYCDRVNGLLRQQKGLNGLKDFFFFWVTTNINAWGRIYRRTAPAGRATGGKQKTTVGLSKLHWAKLLKLATTQVATIMLVSNVTWLSTFVLTLAP